MTTEPDVPEYRVGTETRSVAEQTRAETERRQESRRRIMIKRGIDDVFQHLTVDRYRSAGLLLHSRLLPALNLDMDTFPAAHDVLADTDLDWYPDSVESFLRSPGKYLGEAPEKGDTIRRDSFMDAATTAYGLDSPARRAKRVVGEVAASAQSLAVTQGIIPRELDRSSTVEGLSLQMGLQHTAWEMDMPDPVSMFREEKDLPFIAAIGDTSSGKSTCLARIVEDRYNHGHKILDIHDRKKLENGVYDIAQQQQTLRDVRRELGLEPSLNDAEQDQPELEIYVPLSPELDSKEVLYYPDGTCRIKPFAVDVSSLSNELLTAYIGKLTRNQSAEWQRVLSSAEGDWCLEDLAEMIKNGPEDGPVKRTLISRLRTMQQNGWLRDAECDYVIDWHDVFTDTDTITCFSTSLMSSERSKYRVFLYLLTTIYETREQKQDGRYTPATVVMRELSHIAPSRTNQDEDPVKKPLQEKIADKMRKVASESGHEQMELLADTQHWMQVAKRVRKHINVVVMYRLDYDEAKNAFEAKMGRVSHKYVRTVTDHETGEATVLADNQRLQGEGKSYRFVQPVQMVPPACHHVDRKAEHNTGWACRSVYTDEYLGPPPESWPIELPPRLRFDSDIEDISEEDRAPDGIVMFLDEYTEEVDEDVRTAKVDLRVAYNQYAAENGFDQYQSHKTFGDWVSALADVESGPSVKCRVDDLLRERDAYDSRAPYAYRGLRLTQDGLEYLHDD